MTNKNYFVLLWVSLWPLGAFACERYRDVVYVQRGEGAAAIRLLCDIDVPAGEGPFPAVLCVHGGAWRLGDKSHVSHVARMLVARGYVAVSINYRLAPKHPFPAQQQDCHDALRWMHRNAAQYKIDPQRIAGLGYSAGAQMVLLEALTSVRPERPVWVSEEADRCRVRFRAVVAGGTPCDFRNLDLDQRFLVYWLGGTRREFPDRYVAASPAAFVSGDAPPVYFFHGEQDVMVPRVGMLAMAEQLRQAGALVEIDLIPDNGHIVTYFNQEAYRRAIDFLDRQLRDGEGQTSHSSRSEEEKRE
jgi:acetyl esterase/lipase